MLCCSMRDDLQNKGIILQIALFIVLRRGDKQLRLGAGSEGALDLEFRLVCGHGERPGGVKYPVYHRHLLDPGSKTKHN